MIAFAFLAGMVAGIVATLAFAAFRREDANPTRVRGQRMIIELQRGGPSQILPNMPAAVALT
jgi:hypothetical protein